MKAHALCVLVVDDNERVRRAICELLEPQSDIDIVGEASNGSVTVRFAKMHKLSS